MLTEVQKAYIAGIIDGEGSIMLIKSHKNQYPSPCVSIASTDKILLQWIKNTFSKGSITCKKNYNSIKHKDSYTYKLRYHAAIELLEKIEPYLIIPQKKKRAKLILDKYYKVTIRNGRYSEEAKKRKR